MFDIGFGEIFLVAVVALLVLGPERLPKAARFAGLWVRRARSQWYSVKAEFENELASDELKRSLQQTRADIEDARRSLAQGGAALQRDFEQAGSDLRDAWREPVPAAGEEAPSGTDATVPAAAAGEEASPPPETPAREDEEHAEQSLGSAMDEFEPTPIEEDEDSLAARGRPDETADPGAARPQERKGHA